MKTRWSWVQLQHSMVASSELRDMYKVCNREVRKLDFEPGAIGPLFRFCVTSICSVL